MLRELVQEELDLVSGGDGVGGTITPPIIEAALNDPLSRFWEWVFSDPDSDIAKRFDPTYDEIVNRSEHHVEFANGIIFQDTDNDGEMDVMYWEDPNDTDDVIDSWWDEQQDKWIYSASSPYSGGFHTPNNLDGN